MRRRRSPRIAAVLSGAALACLTLTAPALASPDQESILQDDPRIVFARSTEELDSTLGQIKALGVDRVRVTVFWQLIAPRPTSRRRPDFGQRGAAWPGSYPEERWERYDRIAKLANKHGLDLLFTVTGPAPAWAARRGGPKPGVYRPSPADFGDFVTAVGIRYSGSYPEAEPPPPQPQPQQQGVPLVTEPSAPAPEPTAPPSYLPRVDAWSLWNEPNFPSWLSPQRKRVGRRFVPVSPAIYRRLAEAGYAGLQRSSHGPDVILIGETAPRGGGPYSPSTSKTMMPLAFLRELYCLRRSLRPWTGRAARVRGCPATRAARRGFARRHPALFEATGWAHHPYSLNHPPTWVHPAHDIIPLGSLPRMTRLLDRVFRRWGLDGGLPIYITEYGYQTQPPDPFFGVSWRHQASWMSWAEEIAYRNPAVAAFAQFLLVDDAPRDQFPPGDQRRWGTWQSGLITLEGMPKPEYKEYQHPIRVTPTRLRRGRRVRVFGIYRPAATGAQTRALIQFADKKGATEVLREVTVRGERGYVYTRVRIPRSGSVRILWRDPATGALVHSRRVRVRVR